MFHLAKFRALIIVVGLVCAAATSSSVYGQTQVTLREGKLRCFETTVMLSHLANVTGSNARLQKAFNELDVDSFDDGQEQIFITQEQIRIRLMLAGYSEDQFELKGPELLTVVAASQGNARETIEEILAQQLADQFYMSPTNMKITLGADFGTDAFADADFSTLKINDGFQTEFPLGRLSIPATLENSVGQTRAIEIPVSIAIIRDLVRAKKNISPGQTLTEFNIEAVRRPISSRTVRFVSYDQAIGTQTQSDLQQFELIQSNDIKKATAGTEFMIKKNAIVDIIVRRGALSIRMQGAKALGNGNLGDRIVLENLSGKKRILATVIDSSTVEIRH